MGFFDFLNPVLSQIFGGGPVGQVLTGTPQLPSKIFPSGGGKGTIINTAPGPGIPSPGGLFDLNPPVRRSTVGGSQSLINTDVQRSSQPTSSQTGGIDYSDLTSLIASLGASGGSSASSAISGIKKSFAPAFADIERQRGVNKKTNRHDRHAVRDIYRSLSKDYKNTANKTDQRYDQYGAESDATYGKASADVNARYDKQVSDMVAELTKLGQQDQIEHSTNELNQKRNSALDDLLSSKTRDSKYYNAQGATVTDFLNAGRLGSRLQGADKRADLRTALQNRMGDLDNSWNQLLAQRSGNIANARSQAAQNQTSAAQAQLAAMFKLHDLQRSDALAQQKLGQGPKPESLSSRANIPTKADFYLRNSGLPPQAQSQAADVFANFMQSDEDMVNGQYYPSGSDRAIKMNVSKALQKANAWGQTNGLSPSDLKILRQIVIASY